MSSDYDQNSVYASRKEFSAFLQILSYGAEICTDFHIVDGKILQRSDCNKAIIKCDFSGIFTLAGSFVLPDIKKVLKNLKPMSKIGPFRFKREGTSLLVKDSLTTICIPVDPTAIYVNNRIIPNDEFDRAMSHGPLLLKTEMTEELCTLLKQYAEISNSYTVTLSVRSKQGTLVYGTLPTDIRQEFKLNCQLPENTSDFKLDLPVMPFSLKSDLSLEVYEQEGGGTSVSIFSSVVNENIVFEIYTKSPIVTPD